MSEKRIELVALRETKNKVVYSALEDGMPVESIYVHKASMNKPYPKELTLILQGEFTKSE